MFDIQAAKKAGYSDQEIQSYLASKGQTTPEVPQQDGIIKSIAKGIVDPFIKTGKNIGGAGYELYRAGKSALGDKNAYYNQDTNEAVQNPFLNEEELTKVSQPLSLDKGSALRQQVSDSANIAAWAVPFGKGAGVAQKVLIPGAKVGAMTSINPDVDLEELPAEVLGGAAKGMAMSGAVYGAGKAIGGVKNALTKGGKAVENAGQSTTEGIRQIKLKAEVGGAQQEKEINKILNQFGFKGSPQAQYEKLQPVMTKIETKIKQELSKSPLKFDNKAIKNEIITILQEEGLLVGDKAKKAASQAVDDIMRDVVTKGNKELTSLQLFNVKQQLNKIAQRIENKIEKGITPTATEEVMSATRDALDQVIAKYHPDVKSLTLAQSRLFDAARPLSAARFNPPVYRAFGTSLPGTVTNFGKQVLGGGMELTGKGISKVGEAIPEFSGGNNLISKFINKSPKDLAMNAVTRTPSLVAGEGSQENNEYPQGNYSDQTSEEQSYSELNGSPNHNSSITPLNPYGATINELGQLYALALASGDSKAVAQLKQMYEMELANEERTTKAAAPPKRTESQQAAFDTAELADLAIQQLESGVQTGPIGPRLEEAKSLINMGDQPTLDFNNTISQIKATLAKARAGTSFTPNEEKLLNQYTPQVGDSRQKLLTKLRGLQSFFERRGNATTVDQSSLLTPFIE